MTFRIAWLSSALIFVGCTGTISGPSPGVVDTSALCAVPAKPVSPGTKLVRLTHTQYDNTVRDLLGVTTAPSSAFQKDSTFQGFNNSAVGLAVADRLGRDYRRAAEDLSSQVAAGALSKVSPCSAATDACAKQFIDTFGKRAFRRPLTDAEKATYFTLFKAANTLLDGTDPLAKGVQLTIEAMLQSPNFLYRVELAEQLPVNDMVALNSYEMASRLSYLLWNSMPDDTLFGLADSGGLTDVAELKAQTTRLLADPRARAVVDDFHSQWLDLDRENNLNRDLALFPNFSSSMAPAMQQETLRYLKNIIFDEPSSFASIYTSNYTFVNKELAALYQVAGTFSSSQFSKVTLDPAQRQGLLTQIGFLASHSYARTDSPIHRGVFVIRRVLGLPQGDPPAGIDFTLPPVGSGAIHTTRDQVAAKTSPAGCATCHARINSYGFAFGNYDAVGQYRTKENNFDVDTTGSVALGETTVAFKNALELSTAISTAPDARISYAVNWLRYGYQRADNSEDLCDITTMANNLGTEGYAIKDMIGALTSTTSFRFRPVEITP